MTQTSLAVCYPVVEYDYEKCDFNSLSVDEQIRVTQQKRAKVDQVLASICSRLSMMLGYITDYNRPLVDEAKKLEEEIKQLEQERLEKVRKNQRARDRQDDLLDEAFREFEAREERTYEDFASIPRKEQSKRVKKLFQKIARLTHPDKTDDPEKHKLFQVAKAYYDANDYEGLEAIMRILNGKASSLFDRLFKRLREEIEALHAAEATLKAMKESEDYQILTVFERDRAKVANATHMQARMRVEMLRHQRDVMLTMLGREPKADATFFFLDV